MTVNQTINCDNLVDSLRRVAFLRAAAFFVSTRFSNA